MLTDRLMTIREAAEKLRVSTWMLYRAVERGELPCVRVGRLVRLEPAALDNWVGVADSKGHAQQ